jgi:hypothetical protein
MDVDKTIPRVAVFLIEALQPQDAAQDEILNTAGLGYFPGGDSTLERHPWRCSIADLGVDAEAARRSLEASLLGSRSAA